MEMIETCKSPFITLISPQKLGSHSSDFYIGRGGAPPLNLAYLSRALDNANISHEIIDTLATTHSFTSEALGLPIHGLSYKEVVRRIPAQTSVIAISSMFTSEFLIIRELLIYIKEAFPDALVILGGEHATAMSAAILKYEDNIDYIIAGEGETSFVEFIGYLKRDQSYITKTQGLVYKNEEGDIISNPRAPRLIDIDDFYPLWDKIPVHYYNENRLSLSRVNLRGMPILATRGCPYRCTFCSNEQMWGTRYVMRSVDSIMKEMKEAVEKYKIEHFDFLDLSTSINKKWFKSLLEALITELPGITWEMSVGTRSEILDEEILDLLKRSGTTQITYAPESGSPKISKMIKKKLNLNKMYHSVKAASSLGMEVKSNTIIGFPRENIWDLLLTIKMAFKLGWLGTKNVCIFVFSAYPGSELFDEEYQINKMTKHEYENYMQYYTENTAGARIFDITEVMKYPREQIYTLIGNLVTVMAYIICTLKRPYMYRDLYLNLKNGRPKGPVEQGLYSLIKKISLPRASEVRHE
ncbi:MAG: hypothetical protein CME60_03935 [Halobacteriovoraceae bacterium]|nr:hypothetical protein [Halobacteriovoraceae bacterium]